MKPLVFKAFSLVCGLAALGVPARAVVELQTLVDRSPFAPAGQPVGAGGAGGAEAAPGTLEFRGLAVDAAGTSYSVYDTTAQKGRWLRAEDVEGPIRVKGYDASSSTLDVEQNGRVVKLTLKRATIQAGQSVAAMIPAPPPNASAGTPNNPGAPNRIEGGGGADARRLEAVAAEVRRRRALRNAAKPAGQQPAPQAPAPAPAP